MIHSNLAGAPVTLADLERSAQARVVRIAGIGDGAAHLSELGFIPGSLVARVGQAPFGDPVIYSIRGARLALRKADARNIQVELVTLPPQAD